MHTHHSIQPRQGPAEVHMSFPQMQTETDAQGSMCPRQTTSQILDPSGVGLTPKLVLFPGIATGTAAAVELHLPTK